MPATKAKQRPGSSREVGSPPAGYVSRKQAHEDYGLEPRFLNKLIASGDVQAHSIDGGEWFLADELRRATTVEPRQDIQAFHQHTQLFQQAIKMAEQAQRHTTTIVKEVVEPIRELRLAQNGVLKVLAKRLTAAEEQNAHLIEIARNAALKHQEAEREAAREQASDERKAQIAKWAVEDGFPAIVGMIQENQGMALVRKFFASLTAEQRSAFWEELSDEQRELLAALFGEENEGENQNERNTTH